MIGSQPEDADLYDEVSEEQYKSIVGKRLAKDDFIEDDDGSGYADNGMDVWENTRNESEGSDEEQEKRCEPDLSGGYGCILNMKVGRSASKKTTGRTAKTKPLPTSKPSAYRPQVTEDSENDFMADLLGTVENSSPHIASSSPLQSGFRRKRKNSPGDAYDSGSLTNPSSDGFDLPSSGPLFRGNPLSDGPDGRDIGLWEMRTSDSAKKPRLTVKAEDVETPRNARKGVSFATDMDMDDGFDVGADTAVKSEEVEEEDDDEDFLVRSDRAITAKANQSKARDRLMAAIGAGKSNDATPKAASTKTRRSMVNGSAMSAKLEMEKQARVKAELLAAETKAESSSVSKPNGNSAKGAAERQSWLRLQETLNTGGLNDDSLGSPFTAAAAAQKKYTPSLRIDAFEPLESDEASGMDTESDGEHSDSSIKARQDRRKKRKTGAQDEPDAERNLRFYWLDYLEQDGVVHLLGKVFDRSVEKFVSCCVTITGIQRNLFILPRERRLGESTSVAFQWYIAKLIQFTTDEEFETDQEVSVMDVHREFDALRRKHGVEGGFGMKKVTRKYAFEQPNVPRGEADWYKVIYGYDRT